MPGETVHTRADRGKLLDALADLPALGRQSKPLLLRVGLAMLGRIRRAFVTKARGGVDEAGDKWAPLSPKTLAYGRRGRTKGERGRSTRPSQALTKRQQDRWWALYRKWLAATKGDNGRAARVAWSVLKEEGATTLLQKYGGRRAEILRDTGVLLNSLSPGYTGPEQVLRAQDGAIIVGTNRKGAAAHHKGDPKRGLPQRRLWPPPGKWPSRWWRDLLEQLRGGLLVIATQRVRGAL